jgi:DNA-nicking Smr family endonuclease
LPDDNRDGFTVMSTRVDLSHEMRDHGSMTDPEDEIVLPIEDALDLHPFAPREIPDVVASYLEAALEKGFREVRLIHGRGIGVQRERVRSLLSRHPDVEGYADAPSPRGGWGATVVRLRSKNRQDTQPRVRK